MRTRFTYGVAVLAAVGVAATAPAATNAASSRSGSTHHRARHHRGRKRHRPTRPTAPVSNDRAVVNALRFGYSTAQLDALFHSLPAGPMPGRATARGWVRCRFPGCDSQQANALLNDPLIPLLWRGQQWSTNGAGGTYTNRTLNDSRRDFPAVVGYGPAFMDGRPAIVATYPPATNPPPVSDLILNFRMVSDCVYLGYVYIEPPGTNQPVLLFNVIEDAMAPS
jgi:hypothetical protein